MVLEIAEIEITPGSADGFGAAYRDARHLLLESGAQDVELVAGVESPEHYRLLVHWDSVATHHDRFTGRPAWVEWRAAIGPFFARPPIVEHYETVPADTGGDAGGDPVPGGEGAAPPLDTPAQPDPAVDAAVDAIVDATAGEGR